MLDSTFPVLVGVGLLVIVVCGLRRWQRRQDARLQHWIEEERQESAAILDAQLYALPCGDAREADATPVVTIATGEERS